MMRNIWWIAGLGALVWIGASAQSRISSPLMTAFRATGARAQGYSVNDWVEIHDVGDPTRLADTVDAKLHMRGPLIRQSGPSYNKLSCTTKISQITTRVIVEQLGNGETFLVLDRTSSQGFLGLNATRSVFHTLLKPYGSIHEDINLEGTIAHHLSMAAQKQRIDQALSSVSATHWNGLQTPGYVSYTGRTPWIRQKDSIVHAGAVNIQVATSYNTYLHKTQVYVGTPLITVTY